MKKHIIVLAISIAICLLFLGLGNSISGSLNLTVWLVALGCAILSEAIGEAIVSGFSSFH